MMQMHSWYGRAYGGLGILDDLLALLLLAGLIILGVVLATRLLGRTTSSPPTDKTPDKALEIARERLARGEINAEEFELIKKTLSQN